MKFTQCPRLLGYRLAWSSQLVLIKNLSNLIKSRIFSYSIKFHELQYIIASCSILVKAHEWLIFLISMYIVLTTKFSKSFLCKQQKEQYTRSSKCATFAQKKKKLCSIDECQKFSIVWGKSRNISKTAYWKQIQIHVTSRTPQLEIVYSENPA